jgi:hypothetical protein
MAATLTAGQTVYDEVNTVNALVERIGPLP